MRNKSPLAGQTLTIKRGSLAGSEYRIEDWWENLAGESWMSCKGNPACLVYAMRAGLKDNLPTDDDVLYGKIGAFGCLVHISEISGNNQ